MACLHRLPRAAGDHNQYSPSVSVQLEPTVVRRGKELAGKLRFTRFPGTVSAHTASVASQVFSQAAEGAIRFLVTAGSGESVAKFDDLSVDWRQQECSTP